MGKQVYEDKPYEKGGENDCSGGPVKKRGCTDILCCVLFIVHWVVFLALSMIAFQNGEPARLIAMRDVKGAHCGQEENWNPWNNDLAVVGTAGRTYKLKNHEKAFYAMNVHGLLESAARSVVCQAAQTAKSLGSYPDTYNKLSDACSVVPAGLDPAAELAKFTDPQQIANSLTGGDPSLMSQITKYFWKTCVSSCDDVKAHSNALASNPRPACTATSSCPADACANPGDCPNNARVYRYMPPPTEGWYDAAEWLWANNPAIMSMFQFDALPASVCPEDPMYCVPFPGMQFVDVANLCIFSLDTALLEGLGGAVGSGAGDLTSGEIASSFGSAIGDVQTAWPCFILVAFVSLAVGFAFMILLKFCVGIIVWVSIGLVFALIFGAGGYGFWKASCDDPLSITIPGVTPVATVASVNGTTTLAPTTLAPAGNSTTLAPGAAAAADANTVSTKKCNEEDEDLRDMYLYMSYFCLGLAALYALVILCMCSRIKLGIAINKVAATFLWQTKPVLLVPVVQIFVAFIWWLIWLVVAMFMTSQYSDETLPSGPFTYDEALGTTDTPGECNGSWPSGDAYVDERIAYSVAADNDGTVRTAIADNPCILSGKCYRCTLPSVMIDPTAKPFPTGASFFYAFFSLLWNNAMLIAIGQCTIAGSVAYWYFTPNDKKGSTACVRPALYNCFRYHLGSLAFGAFILAVVQFVKWIMYYLQKQAEQQKNYVMAKIAIAIRCCLECFERLIKFLNKNAYIQIAILGKNFCKSAWNAFCLILRNAARIGILGMIGGMVSMIGVVFITVCTGALGYFILLALYEDDISSPWLCTFIFVMMGYLNSKLFMNVFGLAVDSTLQCFCADEELHAGGAGGAQYTPEELKGFLKDPNKKSKCGCC